MFVMDSDLGSAVLVTPNADGDSTGNVCPARHWYSAVWLYLSFVS